ncbi:MAG TPA: hypothetical protein PLG15_02995 [Candidatus Gastranaerophilaceae bacterium]|nr:hypothetical protein [Candidatus Gastranaerophilaceae bacterium]HPT41331.1 hypothetical protein [Candidatus Gastranaerophilaceae bacterium]
MANSKLSEGVGKKIVEALKKQSEIEINPVSSVSAQKEESTFLDDIPGFFEQASSAPQQKAEEPEDDFLASLESDSDLDLGSEQEFSSTTDFIQEEKMFAQEPSVAPQTYSAPVSSQPLVSENFSKELDSFEIPSNIAVLKKLIGQLPSGVTRTTGAQIIKQTMEALGISMRNVLQEAQQTQEGLKNSARECQNTIQEYKKQIIALEKQSQNYHRQYSALNELISLFVQTN